MNITRIYCLTFNFSTNGEERTLSEFKQLTLCMTYDSQLHRFRLTSYSHIRKLYHVTTLLYFRNNKSY